MTLKRTFIFAAALILAAGPTLSNATDKKPAKEADDSQPGWSDSQLQQPTVESIDLNAYNAIRDEGLQHSHVMDYAGRARRRYWPPPHRLAQHGQSQRLDTRSAHQNGLRQRAPRRLGRVRHRLAATQHLGAHDRAGHFHFRCASHALVSLHKRNPQRARRSP